MTKQTEYSTSLQPLLNSCDDDFIPREVTDNHNLQSPPFLPASETESFLSKLGDAPDRTSMNSRKFPTEIEELAFPDELNTPNMNSTPMCLLNMLLSPVSWICCAVPCIPTFVPPGNLRLSKFMGTNYELVYGGEVDGKMLFDRSLLRSIDRTVTMDQEYIVHGAHRILNVKEGNVALVMDNNIPRILYGGRYYWKNPMCDFVEQKSLAPFHLCLSINQEPIFDLVSISNGKIGIARDYNGRMYILPPGQQRYVMRRDRLCFRGFLPTGQQELTVSDEQVTTRDNVSLTVSLQVFYRIQNAAKCLENVARQVVSDLQDHIAGLVRERARAAIATSTNNADYDNISGALALPRDTDITTASSPSPYTSRSGSSSSSSSSSSKQADLDRAAQKERDNYIHVLCEEALLRALNDIGIQLAGLSKISFLVTDPHVQSALAKVATEKAALQATELHQQGLLMQARAQAKAIEIEAEGRYKAAQKDASALLDTATHVAQNPLAEKLLLLSKASEVVGNTNTTLFLPTESSPMNLLSAATSGMLTPVHAASSASS